MAVRHAGHSFGIRADCLGFPFHACLPAENSGVRNASARLHAAIVPAVAAIRVPPLFLQLSQSMPLSDLPPANPTWPERTA
eukprot:358866-Chlamydomonas_euryale.AAC.4